MVVELLIYKFDGGMNTTIHVASPSLSLLVVLIMSLRKMEVKITLMPNTSLTKDLATMVRPEMR